MTHIKDFFTWEFSIWVWFSLCNYPRYFWDHISLWFHRIRNTSCDFVLICTCTTHTVLFLVITA